MSNVLLYALNLIDLACTLYATSIGATELNPLMRYVPVMVVYKLVVVGALLWWLSLQRGRLVQVGLNICIVVYATLDLYHLISIIWIGGISNAG